MSDEIEIITYEEAIKQANEHGGRLNLLLGNGYTRALCNKFEFSKQLLEQEKKLFEAYRQEYKCDPSHEDCLRVLHQALWTCKALSDPDSVDKSDLVNALDLINEAVLNVRHEFLNSLVTANNILFDLVCKKTSLVFLKQFKHVFTTNYDLALYWDQAISDNFLNDGFGGTDYTSKGLKCLKWQNYSNTYCHYLHGALHIHAADDNFVSDVFKFKSGEKKTIKSSIGQFVEGNNEPLFVAAGTSKEKENKIMESKYLEQQLKWFEKIVGYRESVCCPESSLFIFGSSIAPADDHLWERIEKGNITNLYISTFPSDNKSKDCLEVRMIQHRFEENRKYLSSCSKPLTIRFFDAKTAEIWKARSAS